MSQPSTPHLTRLLRSDPSAMNYSNHSHPICLACEQPTSPSDTTRLSPCNCFPFHAHCISNHELRTRQASKTASLRCPICHTRVASILQTRRYSPPTSRPPFTPSPITHSNRIHPAQPPPTSPNCLPYIPPPPPLADYVLPPPPNALAYGMQPTAPPPTPPPSKSMFIPQPVLPQRSDKIRVYSDMILPSNASQWQPRPMTHESDSCRFQFSGSMSITATHVDSVSAKDRVQPGRTQQPQHMPPQHMPPQHTPPQHTHPQHSKRRRRRKKTNRAEFYWPRAVAVLVERLRRMMA